MKFERKDKYIVISKKDIDSLSMREQTQLQTILDNIERIRESSGRRIDKKYVCISDESKFYEGVWKLLEKEICED